MSEGIEARFRVDFGDFTLATDLRLPARGIVGVFGPSGCGKTTLLRCFAGLQPCEGRLVVNGECWQESKRGVLLPTHRRPLGYVFQEASLFAHLSVRRNLEFGRKRVPAAEQRASWDQAIALFGIASLLERMPDHLSGGERQRVGIARALLTSPRLLLLDEPLASLDLARKQEILPYLERLRDELSIPALYVSHSPDEVARLADHIVVLEGGRVVANGTLRETLSRVDLPIRLGEDAGVVIEGVVAERDAQWNLACVDIGAGQLWLRDTGTPVGARVRVRILARDVSIALERYDSSIANTLAARVVALGSDEHPSMVLLRLRVGDEIMLARLTRRSVHQLGLGEGRDVWMQIKAVALL